MSDTLSFEMHKVLLNINRFGCKFNFYREKLDEYGETIDDEIEYVCSLTGLFHVSKGYSTETVKDSTIVHKKGEPMILVAFNEQKDIRIGDYVKINENSYKVVDKNNIQEYNILIDISLEAVLDGRNEI